MAKKHVQNHEQREKTTCEVLRRIERQGDGPERTRDRETGRKGGGKIESIGRGKIGEGHLM
jgi:hypothetical protein